MKKNKFIFIIISIISISTISSKTVSTTLKDYAYDFSTIGYEISFPAQSSSYSILSAGDYFRAKYDGYSMKVRIETLSRNSKRDFVTYYNENCKSDYSKDEICPMIVEGEVELDDDMQMVLIAKKIDFYNYDRTKVIKSFD